MSAISGSNSRGGAGSATADRWEVMAEKGRNGMCGRDAFGAVASRMKGTDVWHETAL